MSYRWVIVAAGGLIGCVAIGAMFALPVFLVPMTASTGWSRTGVSSAMTIGFLAMAVGSVGWGAFSDRYGPRLAALIGRGPAGARHGARGAGARAVAVPGRLRAAGRARRRGGAGAVDRGGDGLVRDAAQPRRLAGLGRHGHGADDDGAARRLARRALRLADLVPDPRRARARADAAGGAADAPAAGVAGGGRRPARTRRRR